MEKIKYLLEDVLNSEFYQLPKFLFIDEFKKLSNDARILYALLKSRHSLSVKNNWYNENNEVYLIFSRDQISEKMGLSEKTVTKAMNDLKLHGLVREERQGLCKPNKIYLFAVKGYECKSAADSL